jgi:hypothetical protein
MRGDYFLMERVEYHPHDDRLSVRFRNADEVEIPGAALWRDRTGQPDWKLVKIDSVTQGALLVPTLPGQPTLEGETAEIPGDVIRAATDAEFRTYIESLAAQRAPSH